MNFHNMKAKHPMKIVTDVADAMQAVFTDKADEWGQKTGFTERERQITGSSFVTGLVSAWQANPSVSLAGL
ncbi:MAG: hypothetical protein AAF653_15550, partial [Chloroflexota bacterium]